MTIFEFLFYAMHLPAGAGWVMLAFAPDARATARWVHSGALILALCAIYVALLFCGTVLGMSAPGAGMGSLAAIGTLFSHPVGLLTGWVHFLAFDLFVGAWLVRDARALGLSHAGTLPSLLLTLVFGPFGLAAHLLRRHRHGHGWAL